MENTFKFKKGDLEIEFSGEKSYVEGQINNWKVFMHNANNTSINSANINIDKNQNSNVEESHEIKVTKNISLNDFINLKQPENNVDKVITAAYYLERYEKFDSFTEIDLYRILNIEDVEKYLLINMEKGLLAIHNKSHNLTSYTLTFSGEIYVREGLQKTF